MKKRITGWLAAAVAVGMIYLPSVADGNLVDWSTAERVSDGVALVSLSYDSPRLMKAKAMRVDLFDKTLAFTANGRAERWGQPMPGYTNLVIRTRRETVEAFMMNARAPVDLGGRGLDMIAAFNTAPWTPCPEPTPTPYGQVHGYNVSDGVIISDDVDSPRVRGLFVIWKSGRAEILPTPLPPHMRDKVWIAHSGFAVILKEGHPLHKPQAGALHPRTAVGVSRDGRWLYVLAVEGRHPGVSLGADYFDLARIMLSLGAADALNLDGGGSTTLLRWDAAAQRQVACLQQETPPRRNALNIGLYRKHPAGDDAWRRPPDAEQLFEAAIDGDVERSAGVYHHYEFREERDAPPPEGYRPFYITHYGRHGSRYQRDEGRLRAYAVLQAAEKVGLLKAPGSNLLRRLRGIVEAHEGMLGCLAGRGAREHALLAQRMHKRFADVFAGGGKVRCQASVKHRCLTSMANFACSLKGVAPQLDVTFETGDRCMERLLHQSPDREKLREAVGRLSQKALVEMVSPDRLMKLLFRDSPETERVVGSPRQFASDLFALASAYQSLSDELAGGDTDIYDYFTRDELMALARYKNCRYYAGMGNSVELGDHVVEVAKWLADDFIERADEAVGQGGICADLRFGHDSGILPFAGLLGLEGAGDRVPVAESWKYCPLWRHVPMAANIQIVLYRREGGGDDLVKVLFNERETAVRGLAPYSGKYYRWKDFRAHLVKLSADKPGAPGADQRGER